MNLKTNNLVIVAAASLMMLQLSACSTQKGLEQGASARPANFPAFDVAAFTAIFTDRTIAQEGVLANETVGFVEDCVKLVMKDGSETETKEATTALAAAQAKIGSTAKITLQQVAEGKISPKLATALREEFVNNTGGFLSTDGFKAQKAVSDKIGQQMQLQTTEGRIASAKASNPALVNSIPKEALDVMTRVSKDGPWAKVASHQLVSKIAQDYAISWQAGLKTLITDSCIKLDLPAIENVAKLNARVAKGSQLAIDNNRNAPFAKIQEDAQGCAAFATKQWMINDLNNNAGDAGIAETVGHICTECAEGDKVVCERVMKQDFSHPAYCDGV